MIDDKKYLIAMEAISNAKKNIVQAGIADESLEVKLNPIWDELKEVEKAYNEEFAKQLHNNMGGRK